MTVWKFLLANSITEFSHGLGQERTLDCNAANDAVSTIALMFDDPPFGTSWSS
jgi:hypothetical protein